MSVGDAVEHETEIRSSGRRAPLVLAVLTLAAAIAVVLTGADPDDETLPPAPTETSAPSTPTSETLTTTAPPPEVTDVLAVTDVGGGPVPARAASDRITRRPRTEVTYGTLASTPIDVDGVVVVLADDGRLLAGVPGQVFEPFGPEAAVSGVVASNEPRHVWARVSTDELALVSLDGGEPQVRIPVGGDDVLGPASFGVVTMGHEGTVFWRRPSFEPTPVLLPGDRRPVDAGGGLLLVEAREAGDGLRRFETWSIIDGRAVQAFVVREADRPAVIAPDGATVALPDRTGFTVFDATSGERLAQLPPSGLPGAAPVWVGGSHFAIATTPHAVIISGSVRHRPRWPVTALAERAPSPESG